MISFAQIQHFSRTAYYLCNALTNTALQYNSDNSSTKKPLISNMVPLYLDHTKGTPQHKDRVLRLMANPPELLEIAMSYIMLYAHENNILKGIKFENFCKSTYEIYLQKTAQILGMYLIHELEKQDVVEITYINLSKEKQNIPHIKIKHNMLNEILITPLSYNRPKITKTPRPDYLVIEENETQNIITTTKRKSNIFFTSPK